MKTQGGWTRARVVLTGITVWVLLQQPAAAEGRSWFQRHFTDPTWADVLRENNQPRQICRAVERHLDYRTEPVDQWASPTETWTSGRGDCEDFATCIEALCREHGIEASVWLFFPAGERRQGHAVVVGRWNSRLWMSSIGSYEEVKSMDEIRENVAAILECAPDRVWSARLDHRALTRLDGQGLAAGVASAD